MEFNKLSMTEGKIYPQIIKFAMPIFLGNIFQQLYNIVDSWMVGNFTSTDALAAITSTGSLIFLMVGFFYGTFTGAGVVISKNFGAKDYKNVSKAAHTSLALGLVSGIIVTVLGLIFVPKILKLMGTPDDILPSSVLYLRIYFAGAIPNILYNSCTGIFQAVGDSKHPLYYLIIASILNVILDLIFVAVFKWGVAGAAYATVISQTTSATLSIIRLCKTNGPHKIYLNKIKFDTIILKQALYLGLPAGMQNSIISIANIFVQSKINVFGKVAMAGCGSYSKLEGLAFIPITSFALAMTTFIGQNLGAKKYDRAKKGAILGILTSCAIAELIGIIINLFAPTFIAFFNSSPEVVNFGTMQAKTITLFYGFVAFSHVVAGILRGSGKSIVPMIVMLCCWCIFRIIYLSIITYYFHIINVVFLTYPISWSMTFIVFIFYLLKSDWIHGLEKKLN